MDGNREALGTRVHWLSCFGRAGENDGKFHTFCKGKNSRTSLQNSSDHTQPQQIIANYTLCLQVAQEYNIMYHSILR